MLLHFIYVIKLRNDNNNMTLSGSSVVRLNAHRHRLPSFDQGRHVDCHKILWVTRIDAFTRPPCTMWTHVGKKANARENACALFVVNDGNDDSLAFNMLAYLV